jgi:hypothetical protein
MGSIAMIASFVDIFSLANTKGQFKIYFHTQMKVRKWVERKYLF